MNNANVFSLYILRTDSDKRTVLVRIAVGLVFLTEGIQKYLFPDLHGT